MLTALTTAEWALVVAFASAFLALGGLIWNLTLYWLSGSRINVELKPGALSHTVLIEGSESGLPKRRQLKSVPEFEWKHWIDVAVVTVSNVGRTATSVSKIGLDFGARPRWQPWARFTMTSIPIALYKWTNRPKTGYDLIDGELVPNGDADVVRRIFRLRSEGSSLKDIERLTGVNYSTARGILESRVYVGEVVWRGEWYSGNHQALISEQEWERAQRGWVKDRRRQSRHPLSGVVRCGLCGRSASVDQNGKGSRFFRCIHRGKGCDQPRRSVNGIERAALLGLRLVGQDEALQEAIRNELRRATGGVPGRGPRAPALIEDLRKRRRKLLDLHYSDRISSDLFAEQETEMTAQIESLESSLREEQTRREERNAVAQAFEDAARHLADLDIDEIWQEATEKEQWIIASDLLEEISIHPDHLEVKVVGAPKLNVTLSEVGLTGGSAFCGVGERTRTSTGL